MIVCLLVIDNVYVFVCVRVCVCVCVCVCVYVCVCVSKIVSQFSSSVTLLFVAVHTGNLLLRYV